MDKPMSKQVQIYGVMACGQTHKEQENGKNFITVLNATVCSKGIMCGGCSSYTFKLL